MSEQTRARVRITFAKGRAVKYVSHLDLLRVWERVLRRAEAPLAYSQGFHPHPQISIAMPSPVGCTGAREELDVILDRSLDGETLLACLAPQMPPGLKAISAAEVPFKGPSRTSLIRGAEYEVTLAEVTLDEVQRRVDNLLARSSAPITFRRKQYDLRPLIADLTVQQQDDVVIVDMSLLRDAKGRIGRPDVVVQALDLSASVRTMHRKQIIFAEEET